MHSLNRFQYITLAFYSFNVVLWGWLFVFGITEGFYNYLFSFLFGVTPLVGGLVGMYGAQAWGGLSSSLGKGIFYTSLGICMWGCGEMIWSYYNFFVNEPAPYPSLADIFFGPSIFVYCLGAWHLARVMGAQYMLRRRGAKLLLLVSTVVLFCIAYYLLVTVARGGVIVPEGETVIKTILDITYPLGGFVGFALAVLVSGLSFTYLGGRYKINCYAIFLGLFVMFIGDTLFSYTTTVGTYYNANIGDLFLCTGTALLAFGVVGFARHE